jgi:hypothetical protein
MTVVGTTASLAEHAETTPVELEEISNVRNAEADA